MWERLIAQADTPARRIGLIVSAIAVLMFLAAAVHWNVRHEGFVYVVKDSWLEKVPEPIARPNGYWRETSGGWALYDKSCVAEDRKKSAKAHFTYRDGVFESSPALYFEPQNCRVDFVQHHQKFRQTVRQSLTTYLTRAFDSGPLGYFSINAPALILLVLGAFLYSGFAAKSLQWIKSGDT